MPANYSDIFPFIFRYSLIAFSLINFLLFRIQTWVKITSKANLFISTYHFSAVIYNGYFIFHASMNMGMGNSEFMVPWNSIIFSLTLNLCHTIRTISFWSDRVIQIWLQIKKKRSTRKLLQQSSTVFIISLQTKGEKLSQIPTGPKKRSPT